MNIRVLIPAILLAHALGLSAMANDMQNKRIDLTISGSSTTGATSVDTACQSYGMLVHDKIKSNWRQPESKFSESIVEFYIHKGGELSNIKLSKGCGIAKIDTAAVQAVQKSGPFKRLPDGSGEDVLVVTKFLP